MLRLKCRSKQHMLSESAVFAVVYRNDLPALWLFDKYKYTRLNICFNYIQITLLHLYYDKYVLICGLNVAIKSQTSLICRRQCLGM